MMRYTVRGLTILLAATPFTARLANATSGICEWCAFGTSWHCTYGNVQVGADCSASDDVCSYTPSYCC